MSKYRFFVIFLVFMNTVAVATKANKLPAKFENNQIFLIPTLSDGKKVKFFTDTGGGWNAISKELHEEYKWPTISKQSKEGNVTLSEMPDFIEGKSIPKGGLNNFMEGYLFITDKKQLSKTKKIDGFLGGRWHAEKIIDFNYINEYMAVLKSLDGIKLEEFDTISLGFQKNKKGQYTTAFPSLDVRIAGDNLPMLFDTGATAILSNQAQKILESQSKQVGTSYIIASIFDRWRKENPSWNVIEGADTLLGEAMIEVPKIEVGNRTIGPVWFTRRQDTNFHDFMSSMMDKRIDGAIGGSTLQYLRVIIDYANEIAYVSDKGA